MKGVEGVERAAAVDGIEEVQITAKHDQLLERLPEAGSYLGFIFARAGRGSDVIAALRRAHAELHFRIDTAIALVSP
jgi:hypothetical protein